MFYHYALLLNYIHQFSYRQANKYENDMQEAILFQVVLPLFVLDINRSLDPSVYAL